MLKKLRIPWWSSSYDSTLPLQGAQVQSLIWELRFHMPQEQKKKKYGNLIKDKIISERSSTALLNVY